MPAEDEPKTVQVFDQHSKQWIAVKPFTEITNLITGEVIPLTGGSVHKGDAIREAEQIQAARGEGEQQSEVVTPLAESGL